MKSMSSVVRKLLRATNRVMRPVGIEVVRRQSISRPPRAPVSRPGLRLDVGSGGNAAEGYMSCDLRRVPGVEIICNAWDVPLHVRDVAEIYSRHMLEHLTLAELRLTLHRWHDALAVGGRVKIIVPNLRFHIEQWLRADWTQEKISEKWSDASWGHAGLFGWQRQTDPTACDYKASYWDVHKTGFDEAVMKFHLESAGFSDITIKIVDSVHLVAEAVKRVNRGERQVSPTLDGIRADHRVRYKFAVEQLAGRESILDVACGVGYGTRMLGDGVPTASCVGIDLNKEAVNYANEYYSRRNVRFRVGDACQGDWADDAFDGAVSFETLEHLEEPERLLAHLRRGLRDGGIMICSTPNEEQMPFQPDRFPYHVRHYIPQEFEQLLSNAGFIVQEVFNQMSGSKPEIRSGPHGGFMIFICK